MYAYGLGVIGHGPLAAMSYFRAGASMMDLIDAIATWHFGGLRNVRSFLDFAAGYGRSTRFLVHYLPASSVTVGEIQMDALDFQARHFGVSTLRSTHDPSNFQSHEKFDFILVASLFTHLPRRTFGPWLVKLWEMVAPGGVLVFSVHDEVLDKLGATWEDGFAFIPSSEVAALDSSEYGVNFTTESFVRQQLTQAIGDAAGGAIRLPRALCFEQDVWIVRRGSPLPTRLVYENGPGGSLDMFQVNGRRMSAGGWAADLGFSAVGSPSHAISRIDLLVTDGSTVHGELGLQRPDVAAHFGRTGDSNFDAAGWHADGVLRRPIRLRDIVTVVAVCEEGRRYVLETSRVADLLARTGQRATWAPIERRILTAEAVYRQAGSKAVVRLCASALRNEAGRVARPLRRALHL